MITAAQLRAARALLGIDQRKLAELSGLSLPTIQRMEASDGVIRGKSHMMLNDGDIDQQRHIRAAVGAIVAPGTDVAEGLDRIEAIVADV